MSVFGAFGKYTSRVERSARAQVRADGTIVRSRGGKVWRRTPLLDPEGSVFEMSDGGIVFFKREPKSSVSRRLGRLGPTGTVDRDFGRSGTLSVTRADQTAVLSLDDGQFLVASRTASTTVVRRYTSDGRLVRRFGGRAGVHIAGEVLRAADLGDSGSVVLVTSLDSRAPRLAIDRFDANGSPISGFAAGALASVPDFDESRSHVEAIASRRSEVYLLVSTYPSAGIPYSIRNYRIVRLGTNGEFLGASDVVDRFLYPGDSGEPDAFERRIWSSPRGVVYARIEQYVSRSTVGRYSLWNADVTRPPILDRTIGDGQTGSTSSRYFVGTKLALTADGRSLIVCGSTAFYSAKLGEQRIRVALRRLRL